MDPPLLAGVARGDETVEADDLAGAPGDQAQSDPEGVSRPQLEDAGAVEALGRQPLQLVVAEDPVDVGGALFQREALVAGAEHHRRPRAQPQLDPHPQVAGEQRRHDHSG